MRKRPTSITVIAWYLIITGCIATITSAVNINNGLVKWIMEENPMPIPIQYAIIGVGLLVTLISGLGLFKGWNWARILYAAWGVVEFSIGMMTMPPFLKLSLVPGFTVFSVVVFFMFRPKANEFFVGAAQKIVHTQLPE